MSWLNLVASHVGVCPQGGGDRTRSALKFEGRGRVCGVGVGVGVAEEQGEARSWWQERGWRW